MDSRSDSDWSSRADATTLDSSWLKDSRWATQ
jgi:hypothetical protein